MSAVKEEVFAYIKNDLRIPFNVKALGLGPCLETVIARRRRRQSLAITDNNGDDDESQVAQ